MVQFLSLRLNGFKSFVDRTELDIGPGLNGIVGPNGCGKSNLVEALRWVMGESSAKRMRGDGMEDVIFAGTDKRTAKNVAEVALLLDNTSRSAPAAYNNSDEIEVIRRIERDYGSNYKINGKTVRARDVNMLFADTVTGSNSPSMVSQGRVTQIINSKPQERRLILEESAGIGGLYARRHEAEIRLRAADKNLQRIDDVFGSMEGRLNALKRQARQAAKYRNLSTQIRQLEIVIAHLEWIDLFEKLNDENTKFSEAEKDVAAHLATVSQLTKTQTTQMEDLAPLREAEAKAAASLQSQKIILQRVEDEAGQAQLMLEEAQTQLQETITDLAHEQSALAEGEVLIDKLRKEEHSLLEQQKNSDEVLEKKALEKETAFQTVEELQSSYTNMMQNEAEKRAKKDSIAAQIQDYQSRRDILIERIQKTENELKTIQEKEDSVDHNLENDINDLESKIESESQKLKDLQSNLSDCENTFIKADENLSFQKQQLAEFESELHILESYLDDESESVLNTLNSEEGLEVAISRALGDSLLASLESSDKHFWRVRSYELLPDLPIGISSLLHEVHAPKELHTALSQIGLVASFEEGENLFHKLRPGQSLVSKEGHYWRWDGLCMKAEAKDRHAIQLEQHNKLRILKNHEPQIRTACEEALQRTAELKVRKTDLTAQIATIQKHIQDITGHLTEKRIAYSAEKEGQANRHKEINRLAASLSENESDLKEVRERLSENQNIFKSYETAHSAQQEQKIEAVRLDLNEARDVFQDLLRAYDRFEQELRTRKARLQAIADERITVQNRTIRSKERIKTLEARKNDLQNKLETLQLKPDSHEEDKQKILDKISALEEARQAAADKLGSCEIDLAETLKALKNAESVLGDSREKRAAAQAMLSALKEQQTNTERNIQEKFDMKPNELKTHVTLTDEQLKQDTLDSFRAQKETLTRNRDMIGPVNLQADDEAIELEKELSTVIGERDDLVKAIEELRTAIQKINTEARERLLRAFDHVNKHFQELFVRLFSGGKAHLALIESDDPLEGGLEIYAQPPGKALQSLSLMSGGEQTLASIALIFAMFLTNPSPICVLDEIDAPLDDANVDRVCDLLEEISMRGDTRFVIITHHRMTMARMDRLYGVTMAEKGVSQLVSVDLQQSFEFLDKEAA